MSEGNFKDAIKLLEFGACVKECPRADSETVQCKPTSKMIKDPEYYKDCVYYVGKTQYGKPFRFNSTEYGGHFCLPEGEYAGSPNALKAFKEIFF